MDGKDALIEELRTLVARQTAEIERLKTHRDRFLELVRTPPPTNEATKYLPLYSCNSSYSWFLLFLLAVFP